MTKSVEVRMDYLENTSEGDGLVHYPVLVS